MKGHLLLAISALAMSAVWQPLFAAEAETPAPREGAPAAERERAPVRERAARERAPAQRQAAAQSSQSSYTGSQAGGFGGGNVGGGSFADPVNLCAQGLSPVSFSSSQSSQSSQAICPGVPYNYSASHTVQGQGGAFYSYSIPLFGWAVIGVQGEVAAGSIRTSNTQSNTHLTGTPFGPDSSGRFTTETYSSSFNQGTNGSVLVKFGVPISIPLMFGKGGPGIVTKDGIRPSPYNASQSILIYGLVGTTFARIDGSYAYTGTNCPAAPLPCTGATSAAGALNWSQTRSGVAAGIGAEWQFMPGVNLKLEYRYTSFGNISQDVPVTVTSLGGSPCSRSSGSNFCTSTAHIAINNLNNQTVRLGVGFGL
jgi:Outer membrane protein beta-barrel domain